ncbi:MerR family transcriptional regulator (plasmid) [Mycetohabitans rhizoxinica]|uniref:MerR family transcriptional regulator n=1 Tax=Mycetohabitans rhizoxinica TaxID=412963 RepID=UPI0030CD02EB
MRLTVGELAKRSGLTVRTLHHYDAIGLLKPSARSEAGYRLYSRDDVARLYQIHALRRFGMSLADIGACLDRPDHSLVTIVQRQIGTLDAQLTQARLLREQLARLHEQLLVGTDPDQPDWLITLEMITVYEKYFSDDELNRLPLYRLDEARENEWREVVAQARVLIAQGVPPQSDDARALAKRWMAMVQRDTGGDPRLLAKLNRMYEAEPTMQSKTGISPDILQYVLQASWETKMALYEKYLLPDEVRYMRAHYSKRAHEWPELIGALRTQIEQGAEPSAPAVRRLAQRWLELFRSYAGDDPATQARFRLAHEQEPELLEDAWADAPMLDFLKRAVAAASPA